MYQPGDDASHLLVNDRPCTECEGEGKVTVGVEPTVYSGEGRSPRFRDVVAACSHCDGTGTEPTFYCYECEDVRVAKDGDQCKACGIAEARGIFV